MELVSGGTAEKDFYSHAREGRDEGNLKLVRSINISTHTPARGVTCTELITQVLLMHFYSHAREGRDGTRTGTDETTGNFYSHAREGRDKTTLMKSTIMLRFLLTRPRGA